MNLPSVDKKKVMVLKSDNGIQDAAIRVGDAIIVSMF